MISNKIKTIINQEGLYFETALKEVKTFVAKEFVALNRNGNKIIQKLGKADKNYLKFIIGNYAAFSQEAIHMLVDAMMRNHDWPLLFEEIQNNINEEKGSETKGIPHLEIMREGYRKDLGLEVDIQYFKPSLITTRFLNSMKLIFNNDDNAFSAGALIAFESTAIEEFYIIDLIIKKYLSFSNEDDLGELPESLTKYYIDGHKLFEIGHENHLIEAIRPYITKENSSKMIRGYIATSLAMDTWWRQLFYEATFETSFLLNSNFKQKLTSVEENIAKNYLQ